MVKRKSALLAVLVTILALAGLIGTIQAQEFGINWSATFFPTNNLTGAGVPVTGINGVNFDWGTGVPVVNGVAVPGIPADNFSARFTSSQNFNAGTYTFSVTSDDGVRVFINGQLVLNSFIGRPRTTDTFTQVMAGGPATITIEYFEGIDRAVIIFNYVFGGVAVTGTPVATAGPSPTPGPTNTPAPTGLPAIPSGSLTATVIRAPVLNVRAAPSVFSERVGTVLRGQTYQVIGRDERARWFLLQLSDRQGWALGYYLFISGNEFNAPVVSDFVLGGNPAAQSPTGVVAQSFATVRLRALPTIYSEQIGRITWGGAVAVVGRTPSGEWWQVVWKGTTGWAASGFFRIVEGNLASVPIIQP